MMLLGGTFSVKGSQFIGYPSAGTLGCITIAFVAGVGWKKRTGYENVGAKRASCTIVHHKLYVYVCVMCKSIFYDVQKCIKLRI